MQNASMEVTLTEIEAAINWWRQLHPSDGHSMRLAPEVAALSKPYALLIWNHAASMPLADLSPNASAALTRWREAFKSAA